LKVRNRKKEGEKNPNTNNTKTSPFKLLLTFIHSFFFGKDAEEVFKYSDEDLEENGKEKQEWSNGPEQTSADDTATEAYSPPNLPHEEFEVEKLDELLEEHIQIQRDEFYQESVGQVRSPSKYWAKQPPSQQPQPQQPKEEQPEPPIEYQSDQSEGFETYPNVQQEAPPQPVQPPPAPQQLPRPQQVYESFDLKIISTKGRTGFEEHKDYPIEINSVIAGRYLILEYIGAAAFSHAVRCEDLLTHKQVLYLLFYFIFF
jgi:hypothetical protein